MSKFGNVERLLSTNGEPLRIFELFRSISNVRLFSNGEGKNREDLAEVFGLRLLTSSSDVLEKFCQTVGEDCTAEFCALAVVVATVKFAFAFAFAFGFEFVVVVVDGAVAVAVLGNEDVSMDNKLVVLCK